MSENCWKHSFETVGGRDPIAEMMANSMELCRLLLLLELYFFLFFSYFA